MLYPTELRALMHGEGEIRTHGAFRHAGFQDRFLKPLGHFSNLKVPEAGIEPARSTSERF